MTAFLQAQGDLDLSMGRLVLVSDVNTLTAQKLTNRFQFFLGEWFMNALEGIPYYQQIFVKNPDINAIGQLFYRVITQTPGVRDVRSASLNFISTTRQLLADFVVVTDTGAILTGGLGQPFVVTQNGTGTA